MKSLHIRGICCRFGAEGKYLQSARNRSIELTKSYTKLIVSYRATIWGRGLRLWLMTKYSNSGTAESRTLIEGHASQLTTSGQFLLEHRLPNIGAIASYRNPLVCS